MTRQQLAERYGARPEDATAVQNWAVSQGLSVSRIDLARRQVHLVGSVEAMSRAFGVKLSMYEHSRTKTRFRCPENNVHVPDTLAPIITGVFGLNNMPVVVRYPVRTVRRRTGSRLAATDPKTTFPGSFYPNEVAHLYNFPPQQGAGQRVAILEFGGGFDQAALADYFTKNIGLDTAPTVNALLVLGQTMQLDDPTTGEVYLDIEVVGAMAPKATQDVYFAPWSGAGYLAAIDQAVHNDDYAAISISYGLDEDAVGDPNNPGWTMLHTNVDQAFQEAIAVGIPVFVSSGDQGSSCLRGQLTNGEEVTLYSKVAHAAYPASSPYATSVGGTLLYAENGAISKEVVWNELCELQQGQFYFGAATGGGVSTRYQVPSYQSNAGITPQSVNNPPVQGRGVPDVAGNAGETSGYLVTQPPGSQVPIAPVGGTSASAPMWAALLACIREALNSKFNGQVPAFFFNDFVYAKGNTSAFRDIVGGRQFTFDPQQGPVAGDFIPTGNNRSTQADGYYAKEGFDLCTGWGSPNGNELLKQLEAWLAAQPGS
jgi:kumamolisin